MDNAPSVQRCMDRALAHLQIGKTDLDRGLALHRESLVCDAFCLGFHAAGDGEEIKARMDAGAGLAEIRGLMTHQGQARWHTDPAQRNLLGQVLDHTGLDFYYQNVTADYGPPWSRLALFTYLTDRIASTLGRVAVPEQIPETRSAGRHGMAYSLNYVPLPDRTRGTVDDLHVIRIAHDLGVRMMHLTYNRQTLLGAGCFEAGDGGLTDLGAHVVREMNRVGVLVDVAHSGWRTSKEAAEVSEKPVVASHTTCCALHEHVRSKPDEVIRAIADTGGYIGITWIPEFLGGAGTLVQALDHVAYAVRTFGADHVAVGTDVTWRPDRARAEADKFPRPSAHYHPPRTLGWTRTRARSDPSNTTEQLESLALTNWPLLTAGLVQRGLSDEDIRKVIGENVLRVARATWAG